MDIIDGLKNLYADSGALEILVLGNDEDVARSWPRAIDGSRSGAGRS